MIVTNNRYGISTPYAGQHGYDQISDRGKAFGMPTAVIDGNDPEASYAALQKAMHYVRTERKPYLLEAMVSRLHGHSSASGANFVKGEVDCLERFEADAREPQAARPRRDREAPRGDHAGAARRVEADPQRARARAGLDLGARVRGQEPSSAGSARCRR